MQKKKLKCISRDFCVIYYYGIHLLNKQIFNFHNKNSLYIPVYKIHVHNFIKLCKFFCADSAQKMHKFNEKTVHYQITIDVTQSKNYYYSLIVHNFLHNF